MGLSSEQQKVYDWLADDLNLPVFAEAYKGAVSLLGKRSPGYILFVAHASRDLMNSLAPTYKGIERPQVQYHNHLDNLQGYWKEEWGVSDGLSPKVIKDGHQIPVKVCQKIDKLIEDHKSGRLRSSENNGLFFSTFLDYSDKDKIPKNFLSEWKEAKDWFLGKAHVSKKTYEVADREELIKYFNCLDGYLQIAARSQYERLRELNEILDATNR